MTQLIYFGGGLACLLALGQLFRKWKLENLLLSLLLTSIGFWQIALGMLTSGDLVQAPWVNLLAIFFACIFGPLFYIYFRYLTDDDYHIKPKLLVHLVPGLAAFAILSWWGYQHDLFTVWRISEMFEAGTLDQMQPVIFCEIVYVIYYVWMFSRNMPGIWRIADKNEKKKLKHIMIIIGSIFLLGIIITLFALLQSYTFGTISGLCITIVFIYIFFIGQRYPDLILFLVEEEKKIRYTKSQITNIDLENLHTNLVELFEEEKIFCNEDLTLGDVAGQLHVTTHQLSEYLNQQLNTNFKTFLNGHRVQEAQKMLLDDEEANTLSVAFAVGFNSSSAFHNAFRKVTGLSPGQFRKKMKPASPGSK